MLQVWSWFRRTVLCPRGQHLWRRWNVGLIAGRECVICPYIQTIVEIIRPGTERSVSPES